MGVNLDKLFTSVVVNQGDQSLTAYNKINLDKLYSSVTVQQTDQTLTAYNKINLDKIHITIAVRGPSPGIGVAPGTGGIVRGLSEVVLAQRPTSDTTLGSWLNQAGSAVLYTALNKPSGVDDSTYVVADPAVSNDTFRVKLEVPTVELGDEFYVDYRIGKNYPTSPQQVNATVKLYQGAAVIATWTHTNVGAMTDIIQTLTAPQVAAITDYTDLYLEFVSSPQ